MIAFLIYLLKVLICSGILFGYYLLALRNRRFHQWNRFYLLSAVVLSLLAPLAQVTITHYIQAEQPAPIRLLQVIQSADNYLEEVRITTRRSFTIEDGAWILYALISAVLLFILLRSVNRILQLARKHTELLIERIRFVRTQEPGTPFSFFRYIFWNEAIDPESASGRQIFRHELVHVREKHSFDKLFMELVLLFFWMNPFFWIIRRELKMVHEFIADQRSVGADTAAFAAMIHVAYPKQFTALSNPFFQTPIKRRLHMLSKKTNPKWQYLGRLLALPVIACTVLAFTVRTKAISTHTPLDEPLLVALDAGHGLRPDGSYDGAHAGGSYEDVINLQIVKKIAELNTNPNIRFLLTRPDEQIVDLKSRVDQVRTFGADLLLSIHVNAQPGNVTAPRSGIEVRIPDAATSPVIGQQSQLIGSALVDELSGLFATKAKLESVRSGIYVLKASPCPSALIECGYLTNPRDLEFLRQPVNQEKIARQILRSIERYAAQRDRSLGKATQDLPLTDTTVIPLYIVNGNQASKAEIERIDPNTIDRVNVLKGQDATRTYGKQSALGVVEIYTRPRTAIQADRITIKGPTGSEYVQMKGKVKIESPGADTYYLLNGEPVTAEDVKKIDPNRIESINVLKGSSAEEKYGSKAKNGAVEIYTKDGITQLTRTSNLADTVPYKSNDVFVKAETQASIGSSEWRRFLERHLQPVVEQAAKKGAVPGTYTVMAKFIVERDGSLSEIRAIKDPGYGLGAETVALLKNSPKWTPATQNGREVRSYHTQPITFVITK